MQFKSAASTYLTELQGYCAEYYAKENMDFNSFLPQNGPNSGSYYDMSLQDFNADEGDMVVVEKTEDAHHDFTESEFSIIEHKIIYVKVDKGMILEYSYCDGVFL